MESGGDTSLLDSKRELLSSLRAEEEELHTMINDRKKKGLRMGIHLSTELTAIEDAILQCENEVIELMEVKEVPTFNFDMNEVLNPLNVELRAKVRKELRLVLKDIKYWAFGKEIYVQLQYFNGLNKHQLIINNSRGTGEVIYDASIEDKATDRIYSVSDEKGKVFGVELTIGTDIWVLRLRKGEDPFSAKVQAYLGLMKPEGIDLTINEEDIEWFGQ